MKVTRESDSEDETTTKYEVPEGHWEDDDPDPEPEPEPESAADPVRIDSHTIDVVLTTDPDADMGYGREKWSVVFQHDDGDVYCLYATEHRWKGNYWRDVRLWDWRDVPTVVRRAAAAIVECDGHEALDPGGRVVGEDGESTWRSDHGRPTTEPPDDRPIWDIAAVEACEHCETAPAAIICTFSKADGKNWECYNCGAMP